jgi:hypothetical protein
LCRRQRREPDLLLRVQARFGGLFHAQFKRSRIVGRDDGQNEKRA